MDFPWEVTNDAYIGPYDPRPEFPGGCRGAGVLPAGCSGGSRGARGAPEKGRDGMSESGEIAVHADPDDAGAWRQLGLAAAESGRVDEAVQAFRRAMLLRPADLDNLVDLANASCTLGRVDEAVELLSRAVDLSRDSPPLLANLLEVLTAAGRTEAALEVASRLVSLDPKNVRAVLTVAELSLSAGDNPAALRAFTYLRSVDDHDGHAIYAAHGQVTALLRDERWRAALEAAIDATRLDRYQLTTDLLSYAATKVFGPRDHPCRPWDELESALAVEREEHHRLHEEESAA